MGQSWEDLLNTLTLYREQDWRTEPERDQARIQSIEFVLQRVLEKLRDNKT